MITRTVHNTGMPLNNPRGQILANTVVSFVIINDEYRRTDVFDYETGERISGEVHIETDENGLFSVDLFPTSRADRPCHYLVHVRNNAFLDFRASLQEGGGPLDWFAFKRGGIDVTPWQYGLIQYWLDNLIDDTRVTQNTTWSSQKIMAEVENLADIDDSNTNSHSTWSSEKIQAELDALTSIDDTVIGSETTWSSSKILSHTFTHVQDVPELVWTITHNMGGYPSVTVVDSAGSTVLGDVNYISENEIELVFSSEFSGKAYLR